MVAWVPSGCNPGRQRPPFSLSKMWTREKHSPTRMQHKRCISSSFSATGPLWVFIESELSRCRWFNVPTRLTTSLVHNSHRREHKREDNSRWNYTRTLKRNSTSVDHSKSSKFASLSHLLEIWTSLETEGGRKKEEKIVDMIKWLHSVLRHLNPLSWSGINYLLAATGGSRRIRVESSDLPPPSASTSANHVHSLPSLGNNGC